MADNLTGEVTFDAAGKSWRLVYSVNALIALENRLDMSVSKIGQRMAGDLRMGFLRDVFVGGLRTHHPEVTDELAGDLIQEVGGAKVGELIGQAFSAAFPREAEEAGAGRGSGPRARRVGTGPSSTTSGSSSS